MSVLTRSLLIGIGALALTTLTIHAVDKYSAGGATLVGSAPSTQTSCPEHMVLLSLGERDLCVDSYEASPGNSCSHDVPTTVRSTEENYAQSSCEPVSMSNVAPWTFVSLTQAQQLCARVGKRLPSALEWYAFSSGVRNESECVLDANAPNLTGGNECVNELGVHDSIGNVWEWVAEQVQNGKIGNTVIPDSGYVSEVDLAGMPLATVQNPDATFGNDYVTSNATGTFGVVRGGFYGSREDGGLFAVNTAVPYSLATPGIGFRCVKDVR